MTPRCRIDVNISRFLTGGLLALALLVDFGIQNSVADDGSSGDEALWAQIATLNQPTPIPDSKQGQRPTEAQIKDCRSREIERLDKLMAALADWRAKYSDGAHATDSLKMMERAIAQAMKAGEGHSPKACEMIQTLLAEDDLPESIGLGIYMARMVCLVTEAEEKTENEMCATGQRPAIADQLRQVVTDYGERYPESRDICELQFLMARALECLGDAEATVKTYRAVVEAKAKMKPRQSKTARNTSQSLDCIGKPLDMKFVATDGREVDLSAMKGKVVLVDFWATWCGPCVAELPNVKRIYEQYRDKGFEVVGISFDKDKAVFEKMLNEKSMDWPQYYDGKGWDNQFGRKLGISGLPVMMLIGKDGLVKDVDARKGLDVKVAMLLGIESDVADAVQQ